MNATRCTNGRPIAIDGTCCTFHDRRAAARGPTAPPATDGPGTAPQSHTEPETP